MKNAGNLGGRVFAHRVRTSFDGASEPTQVSGVEGPSLHTNYPAHRNGSVPPLKSEYKNLWDTSLFYPNAVSQKTGQNIKVRTGGSEAHDSLALREEMQTKHGNTIVVNKIYSAVR